MWTKESHIEQVRMIFRLIALGMIVVIVGCVRLICDLKKLGKTVLRDFIIEKILVEDR